MSCFFLIFQKFKKSLLIEWTKGKLRVVVKEEVHCGGTNCVGSVQKTGRGTVDNHVNSTRSRMFPSKKKDIKKCIQIFDTYLFPGKFPLC